ncbi:hypothetical protein [uncultured Bartonella sp.]|uniref:hypothetical protein n=1 Tax=uncultured Bartonella sp. TaxID=104108 RepID=UPI00260994BA|nr:hypothetical protein [uncultured Bartonella sp.]
MILKHLKLGLSVLLSEVFITSLCSSEIVAYVPPGRYCGFVYNAGYIVCSQVLLDKTEDGRIVGKMIDGDGVTEGTIEERV